MKVQCEKCKKSYNLDDSKLEKGSLKVQCPKCKNVFVVSKTPSPKKTSIFAPGARIVVRDAEWLVRRVDRTPTGGQALKVIGISELVKDKEAIFLED